MERDKIDTGVSRPTYNVNVIDVQGRTIEIQPIHIGRTCIRYVRLCDGLIETDQMNSIVRGTVVKVGIYCNVIPMIMEIIS